MPVKLKATPAAQQPAPAPEKPVEAFNPATWPASKVDLVPVSALKEAVANSRVHSDVQVDQIAASIKKFGWTIPVLVDETGMLIAGHARVRAAIKLGITEVPVMRAVGWSDEAKEAYQITDNRLAENATWDDTILTSQIKRLMAYQFDVGVLGLDLSKFDLGIEFNPDLAPGTNKVNATADSIAKKQGELNTQFEDKPSGVTKTFVCPHCGESFGAAL